MLEAILTSEELAAIQEARGKGGAPPPPRSASGSKLEAEPMPLISEDGGGAHARPHALALANRWAPALSSRLRRAFGLNTEIMVVGAEVVDPTYFSRELNNAWTRALEVDSGHLPMVCVIGGTFVEGMASAMLGGRLEPSTTSRGLSPAARGLFGRCGRAIIAALQDAWREEDTRPLTMIEDVAQVQTSWRRITDGPALMITLEMAKPVDATFRLIASPETFVPPRIFNIASVAPGALEEVLGRVPLEVRVELGSTTLSMRQLHRLEIGTLLELDRTTDEPLPIRCGELLRARGRPLSTNGNLAIEVKELTRPMTEDC